MKTDATFLVVGLGLMGGSYAMGLQKQGYNVTAFDRDEASIQWALEKGIISSGTTNPAQAQTLVQQADIILLALYPKDILPWLENNLAFFKQDVLLTDLAGVKSCFVSKAQEIVGTKGEFIPSHPMAGREVSGVQNASDAIFNGANFIITPTSKNTPKGIEFVRQLALSLGFGRITQLTIEEHDTVIGYVSQLTHAIAVCLMNANGDPILPQVTGDSFRDLTRIADINGELWSELFLSNAPALVQEIDAFTTCLQTLKGHVETGNKDGLKEMFAVSSERRQRFNKTM